MSEGCCSGWMTEWRRRLLRWLNDFRHTVHWWGFSPVCVHMCWWRLLRREKSRWQVLHLNGFSPVCVSMCWWRLLRREKSRWQVLHLNGFSPVWVSKCLWRLLRLLNFFWQTLHWLSVCVANSLFTCLLRDLVTWFWAPLLVFLPVCLPPSPMLLCCLSTVMNYK